MTATLLAQQQVARTLVQAVGMAAESDQPLAAAQSLVAAAVAVDTVVLVVLAMAIITLFSKVLLALAAEAAAVLVTTVAVPLWLVRRRRWFARPRVKWWLYQWPRHCWRWWRVPRWA